MKAQELLDALKELSEEDRDKPMLYIDEALGPIEIDTLYVRENNILIE